MLLSDLQARVRIALTTTIVDEWGLLSLSTGTSRPSERAVAFHLGWHLRPMIERTWDIDCEYNRSGMALEDSVKLVDHNGRGIPDLIVHHRGKLSPEHNLLLLELSTGQMIPADPALPRATSLQRRFGYQYAGLLELNLATYSDDLPLAPRWQWSVLDQPTPLPAEDVYSPDTLLEVLDRAARAHRG